MEDSDEASARSEVGFNHLTVQLSNPCKEMDESDDASARNEVGLDQWTVQILILTNVEEQQTNFRSLIPNPNF